MSIMYKNSKKYISGISGLIILVIITVFIVNQKNNPLKADQLTMDNFCDSTQSGLIVEVQNKDNIPITGFNLNIENLNPYPDGQTSNGLANIYNSKTIDQATTCLIPGNYNISSGTSSVSIKLIPNTAVKLTAKLVNETKSNYLTTNSPSNCPIPSMGTNKFIVANEKEQCVGNSVDVFFNPINYDLLHQNPPIEDYTETEVGTDSTFSIPAGLDRSNVKDVILSAVNFSVIKFLPSTTNGKFHIDTRTNLGSATITSFFADPAIYPKTPLTVVLTGDKGTVTQESQSFSPFSFIFANLDPGGYSLYFTTQGAPSKDEDSITDSWIAPGLKTIEINPGTNNQFRIQNLEPGI